MARRVKSPPAKPLVEPQHIVHVDQPDETKGSDSTPEFEAGPQSDCGRKTESEEAATSWKQEIDTLSELEIDALSELETDTLSEEETEEIIEKDIETIFEQDGEILNEQERTEVFGQDKMPEEERGHPDEEEGEETLPGQDKETIRELFTGRRMRVVYVLLRLDEILQELIALEPDKSVTDTNEIFETWAMQMQSILDVCKWPTYELSIMKQFILLSSKLCHLFTLSLPCE